MLVRLLPSRPPMCQPGRYCVVTFISFLLTLQVVVNAAGSPPKASPEPLLKCDASGPRAGCGSGQDQPSEAECANLGCCYMALPSSAATVAASNLPTCFHPNGGQSSYALKGSLTVKGGTARGFSTLTQGTMPNLGQDMTHITIQTKRIASNILQVKIGPTNTTRWEVPNHLFERTAYGGQDGNMDFDLDVMSAPLGFTVQRKGSNESIFDTTGHRLVFKDQYIEISTSLQNTTELYGLGEVAPSTGLPLRRDGVPYTLWAHDNWAGFYDVNNYGSHPFYMAIDEGGKAHGVLLWNSNGMEVGIDHERLQYRVIGGLLDFYFLTGPTPADVMQQMTSIVGRPALPPYWALGFMNSKSGYNNIDECEEVVDRYTRAGIPLEVFISDSHYMDKNKLFTLDPKAYPESKVQAFIDKLHENGQRWVPVVEPAVKAQPGWGTYDRGLEDDVFMDDFSRDSKYLGSLWAGASNFPDFLSNATEEWWTNEMERFTELAPYDGIWIDMSEPTSLCSMDQCHLPTTEPKASTGDQPAADNGVRTAHYRGTDGIELPEVSSNISHWIISLKSLKAPGSKAELKDLHSKLLQHLKTDLIQTFGGDVLGNNVDQQLLDSVACPLACTAVQQDSDPKAHAKAFPPYQINSIDGDTKARIPLNYKTIPVTAFHLDGTSAYDAHNLYGHSMARATYRALEALQGTRPFVLARSTFPGTGAYAAHWTGDTHSSWEGLRNAIADIMTNGLSGIAFAGADVCGANATEELCSRWIAAGTLQPLCRDHLAEGHQEVHRWEKVSATSKAALAQRYSLLNYMYTSFFYSSVTGSPVMRPLFFAAPDDKAARNVSYQWMLGDSLMAAPLVEPNTTDVDVYLPAGVWYNMRDYSKVVSKGQTLKLSQKLEEPANVLVAGGSIIPLAAGPAMTTTRVREGPVTLVVALSGGDHETGKRVASAGCSGEKDSACGQMYIDDGEQLALGSARDNFLSFTAVQNASSGHLWALFGGNPLSSNAVCSTASKSAPSVTITDIVILGAQSGKSFTITPTSAAAAPQVGNSTSLRTNTFSGPKGSVLADPTFTILGDKSYDARKQKLHISGLNMLMTCPAGFELAWT